MVVGTESNEVSGERESVGISGEDGREVRGDSSSGSCWTMGTRAAGAVDTEVIGSFSARVISCSTFLLLRKFREGVFTNVLARSSVLLRLKSTVKTPHGGLQL
jgi:hypothetical protein